MERKTYLIEYSAYNSKGLLIKYGKMRVKNKRSEFEAKASFENHLAKKLENFNKLIIHKCKEDFLGGMFGDIFGSSNPFNKY